jgi:predicted RND superfamily exporter protein
MEALEADVNAIRLPMPSAGTCVRRNGEQGQLIRSSAVKALAPLLAPHGWGFDAQGGLVSIEPFDPDAQPAAGAPQPATVSDDGGAEPGGPSAAGDDSAGFGDDSAGFGDDSAGFGDDSAGFGDDSAGFGDDSAGFGDDSTKQGADDSAAPRGAGDARRKPTRAERRASARQLARGTQTRTSIVDETISVLSMRRTRGKDGGITVGPLAEPAPRTEAEASALGAEVLGDPALVGQIVDADGQHSVLIIRTPCVNEQDSARIDSALQGLIDKHSADGFELHLAGPPSLGAAMNKLVLGDLRRTGAIALTGIFFVLVVLFRHPLGVFGPLGVVVLSALATFGTMASSDVAMTMLSNILPAFIIVVGVGDTVHLQSVYRDQRKRGLPNHDAIVYAVATTGMPILFTSLTTIVGLMSFEFATLEAVQNVGRFGAVGVFAALLLSMTLAPIALTFNKHSLLGLRADDTGPSAPDRIDRLLAWCDWLSAPATRWFGGRVPGRTGALGVAALLGVIGVAGATQVRVWHNPIAWMPTDHPTRVGFERLDAEVGGTANVGMLIHTDRPLGIKDLAVLRALEKLEAHVKAFVDPATGQPLVSAVNSPLDIVRETNRALHNGDPAYYKLPDTQRGASDMLFLFENAGPRQLRRIASADLKTARMSLRVQWKDATGYGPFTEHIQAGIDEHIGDLAEVRTTGAVYSLFNVVASLIRDLIRSFGFAFVVITVMMVMLLRSLKLGLVAMVPNLLPILMIVGIMGYADITLNLLNLLIGSIAMGLAVDDTIHFLHHWREHHARHQDVDAAIAHSMTHSGRAMASTSAILCMGFFVYMTARMFSLREFGFLVGTTVILALLIDLMFAPALLRTFYRSKRAAG